MVFCHSTLLYLSCLYTFMTSPTINSHNVLYTIAASVEGERRRHPHLVQKDVKFHATQRMHNGVTLNALIFWHIDLRDNRESGYDYVLHLTCVMPVRDRTFSRVTL